jgi:limonene-1,2-epoxide hydrolase
MTDAASNPMSDHEINTLAERLLAGILTADVDAVRLAYSPDAKVWHNFDQLEQTVDENLATLLEMHRRATGLEYTQIRRFAAPGGFVQQHVLIGQAKGGALNMPAMIRFWVTDGRITRLEEYLDTRQAMVMYSA